MKLLGRYELKFDLKQGAYLAFLLLSFLLPIGMKKVWESPWTFLGGDFNDYYAYFLFLTDIILAILLFFWVADMCRQFYLKGDWDWFSLDAKRGLVMVLFGLLIFWGFSTVSWSDLPFISWYRLGRMVLMGGLFAYLMLEMGGNWRRWLGGLVAIAAGSFIQVIWGGWQYIFQRSLGLWQLGESRLGPMVDGVAKIEVNGEKLIRAYGSLSHANVYGLYLFFSLLVLMIIFLLWQTNFKDKIFQKINNIDTAWYWLAGMVGAGIIISFSRSIWLVSGVMVILFGLLTWRQWGGRKTVWSFWWLAAIVPLIIVLLNFPAIINRGEVNPSTDVSLNVRQVYDQIADRMIEQNYYRGVGLGNFVYFMPGFYPGVLEWWMYEPVHNTFRLIWAEIGVGGFIVYALIWLVIGLILWTEEKSDWRWWWLGVWLAFGWLNMVDHYYWDNWSGQLILVYVWAILLTVPGMMRIGKSKANR